MNDLVNAQLSFNTGTVTVREVLQEDEHWTTFKADIAHDVFVLKAFRLERAGPRNCFQRELKALRLLGDQACVAKLKDFTITKEKVGLLLFEGWQVSLDSVLKKQLTEDTVLRVFDSLARAFILLRHHNLVHRSLRPGAVVFDSKSLYRLTDFSKTISPTDWTALTEAERIEDISNAGLRHFRSPEEIQGDFGPEIDVWRLGCLMYVLLNNEVPFTSQEDVRMGTFRKPKRQLSAKWYDYFARALNPHPSERASVVELIQILEGSQTAREPPLSIRSPPISKTGKLACYFKTSTNSWIEAATSNSDTPPDPVYVQKLLHKAHNKPFKIPKFYAKLLKLSVNKTPVAIKALMLLHRYLFLGPEWVYSQGSGAETFLQFVDDHWQPAAKLKRDSFFNDYFAGLVRQYSRLLREKLAIHQNSNLDGRWNKATLKDPRVLAVLMNYWHKATHIATALFIGETELPQLRAALALLLLEEVIRLVQFLTHVFFELAPQSPQFFPEMLTKFQQNYQKTITLAKTVKKDRPFVQMPLLPEDLPDKLASLVDRETEFSPQAIIYATEEIKDMQTRFYSVTKTAQPDRIPTPESEQFMSLIDANPPHYYTSEPEPSAMNPPTRSPQIPGFSSSDHKDYLAERWVLKYEDLNASETIGSGSSCTVYRGSFKQTPVAVKVMHKGSRTSKIEQEFEREVRALLSIRHPNLVLFMGACIDSQLAIVTEYCSGGSLFKLLHEQRSITLSWKQRAKIACDIARGMIYLHGMDPPIIHRDLKSLNVLLQEPVSGPSDSVTAKVTDFGVSRIYESEFNMTGQMGTCHWMAPEVLANKPYSLKADVYSFGIVMWELAARESPYKNMNPVAIPYRVLDFGERPSLQAIKSCPERWKALMVSCWSHEPQARPSFEALLQLLSSALA